MPESFLNYENLLRLKKVHPAWRLLCLDSAPLILSFLNKVFIAENRRAISYSELVTKLDDYLFFLRSSFDESLYPRRAKDYIDDWSGQDNAFLRIYYIHNSDDPEVDITPATEKAFEWIKSLEQKTFIGTESRLLYLFQLIRDMVSNTEQNGELRIIELEQQKILIEQEIANVKNGILATYDSRQIKERFVQIESTAESLISDFRQVEHNFRTLDREMRERIAISDKTKGKLLDEIFQEQDVIKDSEQGRSFRGFWEYLMTPSRQDEMKHMLTKIFSLPELKSERGFIENIDIHLLDVGERVYRSYNLIAEQLRKYLDNQAYLENKRITELIKSIEKNAIESRENDLIHKITTGIFDTKPDIESTMSRPLFTPPKNPVIADTVLASGESDASLELLYRQYGVDESILAERILQILQIESQVSLSQIIDKYPLEHGLAEIITYLHLASKNKKSVIDDESSINLSWDSSEGVKKQISIPNLIFIR
jgi:hypothetical protein